MINKPDSLVLCDTLIAQYQKKLSHFYLVALHKYRTSSKSSEHCFDVQIQKRPQICVHFFFLTSAVFFLKFRIHSSLCGIDFTGFSLTIKALVFLTPELTIIQHTFKKMKVFFAKSAKMLKMNNERKRRLQLPPLFRRSVEQT